MMMLLMIISTYFIILTYKYFYQYSEHRRHTNNNGCRRLLIMGIFNYTFRISYFFASTVSNRQKIVAKSKTKCHHQQTKQFSHHPPLSDVTVVCNFNDCLKKLIEQHNLELKYTKLEIIIIHIIQKIYNRSIQNLGEAYK